MQPEIKYDIYMRDVITNGLSQCESKKIPSSNIASKHFFDKYREKTILITE